MRTRDGDTRRPRHLFVAGRVYFRRPSTKLACPVRSLQEMSLPFNHPSLLFASAEPYLVSPIFSLAWPMVRKERTTKRDNYSKKRSEIEMWFPVVRVDIYVYILFVIEICFQVKERRKYFLIYNLSNCHKSLLQGIHATLYFIFATSGCYSSFVRF